MPKITIDSHPSNVDNVQSLEQITGALREREERLNLVMQATNDGIWDWDIKTNTVYYSPRWKAMLGYEDHEIENHFDTWRALLHPEDRDAALRKLEAYITGRYPHVDATHGYRTRIPQFEVEHRLRHKDGSYRWILTRGTLLRDAQGVPYRMVGSHVDITSHKESEQELQDLITFQNILTTTSTKFINLAPEEIDEGIERALQAIGMFTGVDRSYVFLYSDDKWTMRCTHEWCAEGIEAGGLHLQNMPVEHLRWSNAKLLRGEVLHIPQVSALPPEAAAERQEFEAQGIQSLIVVPMAYRGDVTGFLGFDAVRHPKHWSVQSQALLKSVGEIFVNALEHKRAQAIRAGQQQFMELLATGGGFTETLEALIRIIEEQSPGMLGLILLLDEDGRHLHIGASPSLPEDYLQSIEGLEIGPLVGSCGTASYLGERVIVEDIASDPRWDALRDLAIEYGLGACWSEPVFSSDRRGLFQSKRVIGTFAMYYRYRRAPTDAELHTIEVAAHLAGIAIEHKRAQDALQAAYEMLEQRVIERTREIERRRKVAEGLREILTFLNSNRALDEIFECIMIQASQLLGASAGLIYHLEQSQSEEVARIEATWGLPEGLGAFVNIPNYESISHRAFNQRIPHTIADFNAHLKREIPDRSALSASAAIWVEALARQYPAQLTVPLIVRDNLYGGLQFYYPVSRTFSQEDIELGATLGEHVALAIENARLREQAEQAAVTAERNRLARDLHDAVSQTLFSATLIADVLPRIWDRDRHEALRRLGELRELTRGALAEMRMLLIELRPTALVEADLGDLLRQLAEAFRGKTRVAINLDVSGVCVLPPDVQVAFYRIAQEALNNIGKHARAKEVSVRLNCQRDQALLQIEDDGRGFDIATIPPDHFGVGIMHERAKAIAADFKLTSQPGQGTQIALIWSKQPQTGNRTGTVR